MLSKFSIVIKFLEDGKIRGRGGEAAYGFLLNEVSRVSEEYAERLHDDRGIKPFSLSPLFAIKGGELLHVREGFLEIKDDMDARLVISALSEETIGVFMKSMINAQMRKSGIDIGGLKARIENVCIKEKEGARFETFSDLLKRAKKRRGVIFNFLTPLSFRQNGIQSTFPEPMHVFLSLLRTWNTFSEIKIPEEVREKFTGIGISRFSLHSELWHFSKYKIFGCRGMTEYTFKKGFTDSELKLMNALAGLATYSGVGYRRTMGMGMVEVIEAGGKD